VATVAVEHGGGRGLALGGMFGVQAAQLGARKIGKDDKVDQKNQANHDASPSDIRHHGDLLRFLTRLSEPG
jgi:hypothetical protein